MTTSGWCFPKRICRIIYMFDAHHAFVSLFRIRVDSTGLCENFALNGTISTYILIAMARVLVNVK